MTYWNINCSITILLIFLSTFIEWEFGMILYSYNLMIIFINMQEILFQTVFLDIFVHIKEAFSSLLTPPPPHLLPIPIKPFSSLQVYFPHSCIIILFWDPAALMRAIIKCEQFSIQMLQAYNSLFKYVGLLILF